MSQSRPPPKSVAIIGAGIVGLACALELARRGIRITLYEKNWPPRGASWAAAGMLAPAFEAVGVPDGHPDLFDLCETSARLWPEWADRIEQESGLPSGYQPGPSLAIAFDEKEAQKLEAVAGVLSDHPSAPRFCTQKLPELEPSLSANVRAGLLLPSDGQADNRRTLTALMTCIERQANIQIVIGEAPLRYSNGVLDHAAHDATLLTAGWQSGAVTVRLNGQSIDIRQLDPALEQIVPIGGQMLSVAAIDDGPKVTIRAGHVYIVPKSDRIVIGATSEPGRILSESEPEQIRKLRDRAIEICPILEQAEILESWAGVRPGLKNHAPLLGETRQAGLFVASGHYRNGILLAPLTARIIADLMEKGDAGPLAARFAPHAALPEQV